MKCFIEKQATSVSSLIRFWLFLTFYRYCCNINAVDVKLYVISCIHSDVYLVSLYNRWQSYLVIVNHFHLKVKFLVNNLILAISQLKQLHRISQIKSPTRWKVFALNIWGDNSWMVSLQLAQNCNKFRFCVLVW